MQLTETEIYGIIEEEVRKYMDEQNFGHTFTGALAAKSYLNKVKELGGTVHRDTSGNIIGVDDPTGGSFAWKSSWAQPYTTSWARGRRKKKGLGLDAVETSTMKARMNAETT